ncbi:MAG: YcgN family cysteine cluster protein, partial [Hyphomicrobiaceae bacterium]
MHDVEDKFWRDRRLEDFSETEWEALCDGCGRCCLNKLEDEDTGDILLTRLACRLLDIGSCQCQDYANRKDKVPECVKIDVETVRSVTWLPPTCAYRLVGEGRDLYWWH